MSNTTQQNNTIVEKKTRRGSVDIVQISVMVAGIVSALFVWFFGFRPFLVNGISMYPSFNASFTDTTTSSLIAGDYLIIDAFSYRFLEDPKRLDVIVAKSPIEPGKHLLKRIIGLPNEQIRFSDTTIEITTADNTSFVLHEPYINQEQSPLYKNQTMQLSENQYFILGDNRMNSLDSRVWGALTKDHIIGRVVLRLYPFNELATLPGGVDQNARNVL